MSTVLTVAAVIVAGLALSTALAVRIGKALHRANHRDHYLGPLNCPPWCVRERAAALSPYGAHRHRRNHR